MCSISTNRLRAGAKNHWKHILYFVTVCIENDAENSDGAIKAIPTKPEHGNNYIYIYTVIILYYNVERNIYI